MPEDFDHLGPTAEDYAETAQLINKHFEIDAPPSDALFERLRDHIRHLLVHDFERLLTALYRIDVREEDFKTVMEASSAERIADELARLVIVREYEKVETRRYYKSKNA